MIIGIDAACLGIKDERLKVGVYQVAVNLFKELRTIDTRNTYYLYSFLPIDKKLLKEFGKNAKNIVVKPVRGWTKIWLPLRLLKDKPDIFVGLSQVLPLKLPLQEYKSMIMIHDVIFEEYPSFYPGSFRKLHRETKSSALLADSIITVSKATKKDIEKFYKVSSSKIHVAYEGRREFPQPEKARQKNPFFLYVGALKPQKNIPTLLKSFAIFSRTTKADVDLILIGGDKWKDKEIDKTYKKLSEKIKGHIHFKSHIEDSKLAWYYKNAIAFVSPSWGEGFGLPFLEAMSFACPILASNTGALPEVVGKAGILVDPKNAKKIAEKMKMLYVKKDVRKRYQELSLQKAQEFSWKSFAERFFSIIQGNEAAQKT